MGVRIQDYINRKQVVYRGERSDIKHRLARFPVELVSDSDPLLACHHDGQRGLDVYPVLPGVIYDVLPSGTHGRMFEIKKTKKKCLVEVSNGFECDYLHVYYKPSSKIRLPGSEEISRLYDHTSVEIEKLSNAKIRLRKMEKAIERISSGLDGFKKAGYMGLVERLRRLERWNPQAFSNFMSQLEYGDKETFSDAIRNGIRIRGKARPPESEDEVRIIFDRYAYLMGLRILHYQINFPDYTVQRGGEILRVEAELFSSNFKEHEHDPKGCDMIVCWDDTLIDNMGLEILELSSLRYRQRNGVLAPVKIIDLPKKSFWQPKVASASPKVSLDE